ncbi:hypothetical protein PEC18_19545, partial [Paucibacter sp. O1-1]|nr:hypothetical protein [Paucibacter sp. O1-1]MDA3827976.1 hypothetical protein [Paucibacter sp. O1-1]
MGLHQYHQADVIDLATRKSVRRVPLGEDPEAFDLSPDGKTLYVTNEEDAAVSFIDLASGQSAPRSRWARSPRASRSRPMA